MASDSREKFNKPPVFGVCEQMGEPAVLADLERMAKQFTTAEQKAYAWKWVYAQRQKREDANSEAIINTARQTMYVAIGTAVIALATAGTTILSVLLKTS